MRIRYKMAYAQMILARSQYRAARAHVILHTHNRIYTTQTEPLSLVEARDH